MDGYLLDNNAVHKWFLGHVNVLAHVNAVIDESPLLVSAITLGEIECGHFRSAGTNPDRRREFEEWLLEKFPYAVDVTRHTSPIYGEIKASIFNRHAPKSKRSRRPEQCYDKATGLELGIDENDLWNAAQAIEHNLVLVSNDRMRHILDGAGNALKWEDWELPL